MLPLNLLYNFSLLVLQCVELMAIMISGHVQTAARIHLTYLYNYYLITRIQYPLFVITE